MSPPRFSADESAPLAFRSMEPEALPETLAAASDRLVVVYLHGADCPNCEAFERAQPQLLQKLATEPESDRVLLLEIDVYEHRRFATEHGVYGIPTFLLFRGGRKVGRMTSFRGPEFWLGVVLDQVRAAVGVERQVRENK